MTPGRYYCHYTKLEEFKAGMWRRVSAASEREHWLSQATAHLRDQAAFRAAMQLALLEWPVSCLYNFTTPSLNKPVWLAHAGAALVKRIPEEFMRLGYWELNQIERARADADAIEIASRWTDPRVPCLSGIYISTS